jgi:hypothetical protein
MSKSKETISLKIRGKGKAKVGDIVVRLWKNHCRLAQSWDIEYYGVINSISKGIAEVVPIKGIQYIPR